MLMNEATIECVTYNYNVLKYVTDCNPHGPGCWPECGPCTPCEPRCDPGCGPCTPNPSGPYCDPMDGGCSPGT